MVPPSDALGPPQLTARLPLHWSWGLMLRGGGGARARRLTWVFLGCRLRHPRLSAHPGREHHRGHAPGSSRTAQPDPPTRHRPIPLLQLHLHRLSGGPPGLSSTRLMPPSGRSCVCPSVSSPLLPLLLRGCGCNCVARKPLNLNVLLVAYLQCHTFVTPVALPCH